MNNTIELLASTTFAGKRFNRTQLVEIQQTVKECRRHLSLRELGHTLCCEHLNWLTPGGNHCIQSGCWGACCLPLQSIPWRAATFGSAGTASIAKCVGHHGAPFG